MKTRHAVLSYHRSMELTLIRWIDGNGWGKEAFSESPKTLYDLAELAYPRFITHLWVMPGYETFNPVGSSGQWGISPYYNRRKEMMGASVFYRGHQRKDLDIIFPQYSAWWVPGGWMKEADDQELIITIHYLEQVLGVPIGASPGRAGWNYLKRLHPEWVEDLGVDLAAMHFDNKAAGDIIWEAPNIPATLSGLGGLYIHKFDKSAAYPYAASQVDMGVGVPVHIEGDDGSSVHEKGHPQSVGVWRCTIDYKPGSYNEQLPPVWKEHRGSYLASEGWLAGPIIRLLRSQEHMVHIHEGWVFPERHDLMAGWARNLWLFRRGYDGPGWKNRRCAAFAERGMKQIANSTIGMTAFRGFENDDDMKRADIRMQAIARHHELTWHNIEKVFRLYKIAPVMVYMDALYFISGNTAGREIAPELVRRGDNFGGYRYEGCIEITDEIAEMFGEKMSTALRLEVLNKKGWVM